MVNRINRITKWKLANSQSDWAAARDRTQNVLALDHDNRDALAFVEAAHTISQFTPNLSFSH